jgi:outer membrane usher protein
MGSASRMAPMRTLSAAMAFVLAVQPVCATAAGESELRLRMAGVPLESPVGGHLAVRELIVDGRSLGWTELVEYGGTLYGSRALLDQLGLQPRRGALSVYTRFENWFALHAIPNVSVYYGFSQKRVYLGTGGVAAVPAEAPRADAGMRLRPTEALSVAPAAPAIAARPAVPATVAAAPAVAAPAAAAPEAPPRADGPGRLLPLDVRVNGAKAGSWLLLERQGALYATPDAFEEWRLSRDQTKQGIEFRGRTWYPLTSIPGYEAQFNFAEQSVDLKFRASEFGATRIGGYDASRPPLSPVLTSFFVNYDVSHTTFAGRDFTTRRDLGALTELGFSSGLGVLTSSHVGRNIAEDENLEPRQWRRLETTFNRDFPDHNVTLRLGDSSTRTSMWGRQVYFGGIQLGRNYALTPGLITYPLPILAGQSSAPSTVELYVNDVLRQTSQVPTGPFTIDNFPLLTGSGQARLVVRDLLGRETVLVQNFFTSAELLDEGLSDWSAEFGAVRLNLGIENADYGQAFGSGLWRYGIDRQKTVEVRAEAGEETQGGGIGLSMELPGQVLGQVGLAGSRNDVTGNGGHAVLGLQHSSLKHGFTLSVKGSSPEYRQIGLEANPLLSRREYSAGYTSYAGGARGSFGLAYARIEQFDDTNIVTMSANYTLRLGARSTVTFTASRVTGITDANAIGASLLIPFDNRISANANVVHREEGTDFYGGASQGLGAEIGVGWRALGGRRAGQNFAEGGLYYQASKVLLTADVNATSDQQTARFGAQGAFVAADGSLFATRRLQNSFAVVEVPGYENVGVGFQSSVLARTDQSGRAIVPNLQPYRQNSIRLDPNELPISAELDTIEQTAVPAWLSGVKVRFPVRAGRGALIKITLADGQPAPAGAVVAIKGDDKEFYVARRGEAFVTGLLPDSEVTLKWNNQSCALKFELPPGTPDDIARVGPVVCGGVSR